jgi:WhiB family transcriptional regulator, redox-sensing transcriptional regulator
MAHTDTDPSASDDAGLCRYGDDSDWFASHAVHRARAIAICHNCPIQRKCALDAQRLGATDGVWAGVYLPGLRDAVGLAAAREKLDKLAERLARQPEAHRRRAIAIRAAARYAADLAQERRSA